MPEGDASDRRHTLIFDAEIREAFEVAQLHITRHLVDFLIRFAVQFFPGQRSGDLTEDRVQHIGDRDKSRDAAEFVQDDCRSTVVILKVIEHLVDLFGQRHDHGRMHHVVHRQQPQVHVLTHQPHNVFRVDEPDQVVAVPGEHRDA